MGIEFTRFVFGTQDFEEEADVAWTVNDGGDIRGGSYVVGALQELEAWAFDTYCSCPQYNPNQTVAPSPPVYPILFTSDVIYGREHFSEGLKMYRGDFYQRTFVTIQDGQFYDLTDCDIRMTWKWALTDSDADAVIVKTLNDGVQVLSYTGGEFQFTINPEDTDFLPAHRIDLKYDAQITDVNGKVFTVAIGPFTILPDVSEDTP